MGRPTTDILSPLFTEAQAALYLTRSVSSLRRGRKTGCGPKFIRLGRSIRYLRADLDSYIRTQVQVGQSGAHRG
jgi:hypothetical protein